MDVRAEVGRLGLRLRKKLGQHFLHDEQVAQRLVRYADLRASDVALEVGPGLGALTEILCEQARLVHAVEKDGKLANVLKEKFESNPKVNIIQGDILRINVPEFHKVVSTPPYSISSRLILFLAGRSFETAVLALQKEFAMRLVSKPGTASYGRLSVTTQHSMKTEVLEFVPRTSFYPQPGVDSSIVRLSPLAQRLEKDILFETLVREVFTQRRRLLRGAIRHYLKKSRRNAMDSIMNKLSIPEKRVFQTSVEEFEHLVRDFAEVFEGSSKC